MTSVAILLEPTDGGVAAYRAIAGARQSIGKTAGAALDALTAKLPADETGTLVIVQHGRADHFFTAEQRARLDDLMARWRVCRDTGGSFASAEQAELDSLVEAEVRATSDRAAVLVRDVER